MKSQITMKDIAQHFGMSLNTIHKAITESLESVSRPEKRLLTMPLPMVIRSTPWLPA